MSHTDPSLSIVKVHLTPHDLKQNQALMVLFFFNKQKIVHKIVSLTAFDTQGMTITMCREAELIHQHVPVHERITANIYMRGFWKLFFFRITFNCMLELSTSQCHNDSTVKQNKTKCNSKWDMARNLFTTGHFRINKNDNYYTI